MVQDEKYPRMEIIYRNSDFYNRSRRRISRMWSMTFSMLASDVLCLIVSAILAIAIWRTVRQDFLPWQYIAALLPVIIGFMAAYFLLGLYPGLGIGPVEELRRLTIGSSLIALGLATLSFYFSNSGNWSRAILGLSWLFILISIPLSRKIFRRLAARWNLWGMPVVVIGDENNAPTICKKLCDHPLTGLWPVLGIATSAVDDVFAAGNSELTDLFQGIDVAIVTFGQTSLSDAKNILLNNQQNFQRIVVVLDEQRIGPLWVRPLHMVEYLGLEVTHNLLNPLQKAAKRLFDLTLILLSVPFWIPFTLLMAALIKLDSPGPAFYTQKRIGSNGKEIKIWKFRSMVYNAEQELSLHLERHPALREEWEQNFKLKNDPRVTRFGSFLRRTSLDEFPQIWNVLKGEMSIIGPRPIVQDEIPLYGKEFEIYKKVLPGLTGMWQVSGRNDVPYHERVNLDVYYVQNWSIWLDIHILIHTVLTVLEGRGAY